MRVAHQKRCDFPLDLDDGPRIIVASYRMVGSADAREAQETKNKYSTDNHHGNAPYFFYLLTVRG
jgi:hypothetical protein